MNRAAVSREGLGREHRRSAERAPRHRRHRRRRRLTPAARARFAEALGVHAPLAARTQPAPPRVGVELQPTHRQRLHRLAHVGQPKRRARPQAPRAPPSSAARPGSPAPSRSAVASSPRRGATGRCPCPAASPAPVAVGVHVDRVHHRHARERPSVIARHVAHRLARPRAHHHPHASRVSRTGTSHDCRRVLRGPGRPSRRARPPPPG